MLRLCRLRGLWVLLFCGFTGLSQGSTLSSFVLDPFGVFQTGDRLRVQYYNDFENYALDAVVFDIKMTQDGPWFQGSSSLRPGDASFAAVIAQMTNGRNQPLGFFFDHATGGGGEFVSTESCVLFLVGSAAPCVGPGGRADHRGMDITEIRLDYQAYPWLDPEHETDYVMKVTLSVIALNVPEPSQLALLFAGIPLLAWAARQRRAHTAVHALAAWRRRGRPS